MSPIDFLLNPNVAYLLLVTGTLLVILAIFNPGTGLLELGALFILVLAGYGMYNLPINLWALILLIAGVIPFLLALIKSRRFIFLIIAILSNIIGASFLFQGESWWQPAVNPILALIVSLLTGGYLWIAITKFLEVDRRRPAHDTSSLIGVIGEAKTSILDEGSVQVAGELWSARSSQAIPAGAAIRVVNKEGFTLIVEPVSDQLQA